MDRLAVRLQRAFTIKIETAGGWVVKARAVRFVTVALSRKYLGAGKTRPIKSVRKDIAAASIMRRNVTKD